MESPKADRASAGSIPCGWCAAWIPPDARRCPVCRGSGPGVRWPDRVERLGYVLIGVPVALIMLGFGIGFLGGWLGGGVTEELGFAVMLVAMLGVVLLVPAIISAIVLGLVSRAATGEPVLASWDVVTVDGEAHAVTLPAFRFRPPDDLRVDGARIRLDWTEEAVGRSLAHVRSSAFEGEIRVDAAATDAIAAAGFAILTGTYGDVPLRATLEIEDALVTPVRVKDGHRAA